jgi:hypothetical protein
VREICEKCEHKHAFFDRLEMDFALMAGILRAFLIEEEPIRNGVGGEL